MYPSCMPAMSPYAMHEHLFVVKFEQEYQLSLPRKEKLALTCSSKKAFLLRPVCGQKQKTKTQSILLMDTRYVYVVQRGPLKFQI